MEKEKVKTNLRQNHASAWALIVFFVLVALLTAVNQAVSLLKNLRDF